MADTMDKILRIAYLGDGRCVHNKILCQYMSNLGHEIHFISEYLLDIPNIINHTIPNQNLGFIRHILAAGKLKKILRQIKPDILHIQNLTGYGYWAMWAGFHPTIVTSWGSDLHTLPNKNLTVRFLVKRVLSFADVITADCQYLLDLATKLGADKSKLHLSGWGIDFQNLKIHEHKANNSDCIVYHNRRTESFLRKQESRYNRQFEDLFNIEDILFVAYNCNPKATFWITDHSNLSTKLRNKGENIKFIKPTEGQPFDRLQLADIYITIPTRDGTSLAMLEAMATGLAIIASDIPANREWIAHNENALLVKVGDRTGLVNAIQKLTVSPELRQRLGAAAHKTVKTKADRQKYFDELIKIYMRLC